MRAAILEIQATDTSIWLSEFQVCSSPRIFRAGLFQYFTYKYVYLGIYDDISIKNIFNTYALKRQVWFSLNHPPTPQYVLHLHRHNLILRVFCIVSTTERTEPSKNLLPAMVISSHVEEKQSVHCLKSSKEKTSFLSEWLRQKGIKQSKIWNRPRLIISFQ